MAAFIAIVEVIELEQGHLTVNFADDTLPSGVTLQTVDVAKQFLILLHHCLLFSVVTTVFQSIETTPQDIDGHILRLQNVKRTPGTVGILGNAFVGINCFETRSCVELLDHILVNAGNRDHESHHFAAVGGHLDLDFRACTNLMLHILASDENVSDMLIERGR